MDLSSVARHLPTVQSMLGIRTSHALLSAASSSATRASFGPHVEAPQRQGLLLNPFWKQLSTPWPQMLQKKTWPLIWPNVQHRAGRDAFDLAEHLFHRQCDIINADGPAAPTDRTLCRAACWRI